MKTPRHSQARMHGSGQTSTEFATVATALLFLIFGLMIVGDAVYQYNTVSSAAREAVRYAVVHSPTSAVPATTSQIQQVALNYAPGMNLKQSDVTVTWPTDPSITTKKDAQVQISYSYQLSVPFMSAVTLNLTSTSRMLVSQ